MNNGWIKSYRKIIDHELLAHDNTAFIVFMKLLHRVDKETGNYTTGRFKLGEFVNLKPTTAWDALKRLEKAKMTSLKSDNKKTVIHICNWTRYQSLADTMPVIKPSSNRQQARHQTVTKQEEEVREKKNKNNSTNVELAPPKQYGNEDVNKAFGLWVEIVGYPITSKLQPNRNAAHNLVKKHQLAGVTQLINGVALAQADRYGPQISDFVELQAKLNALIMWGRKQGNKGKGVKIS